MIGLYLTEVKDELPTAASSRTTYLVLLNEKVKTDLIIAFYCTGTKRFYVRQTVSAYGEGSWQESRVVDAVAWLCIDKGE